MRFCCLILLILFFNSCRDKVAKETLFERVEDSNIEFTNTISNTTDFNIFSYRNFYNGAGVAIGDLNNDGLSDVFFTANMGANKLYLNKGNWKFEDISEKAGFTEKEKWSTGVVFVDINHDGWLDIYVCNAGYIKGAAPENKLYINNHNLTFREAAAEYGLTNKGGYATHAAFFDYDLDGDLDAFIINNSFIPVNTLNYANKRNLRAKDWPVADFLKGGGDHLYRNDNGKFVDVSEQAGIYGSLISFGLGVTVGDINGDHYPDIYVSNDFFERDYLYMNQKDGTFKDELEKRISHTSLSSMGADMGDINNDGYQDIFVTDMLPDTDYRLKTTTTFENSDVYQLKQKSGFYHQFMQNTLQLNTKDGKFIEIANYSGVAASDWSWGGLLFDADNDGLNDLYVSNGIYNDVTDQDFIDFFANGVIQKMVLTGKKEEFDDIIRKMPSNPIKNKVFRNLGNLKFADIGNDWGFTETSFSNGAAYGDLDNDGDLDLIVNNVNQSAFIYRNKARETTKNNFISLQLKGKGQNTYAIGSMVKIFQGNQVISREIIPSRGFQSSVDYKQTIGLGERKIDSVIVVWPDKSVSRHGSLELNRLHILQQDQNTVFENPTFEVPVRNYLEPVAANFESHKEDEYLDFYYERNIPMLVSREGPKATVGDVNGDGLADIYVGGATGQSGQLYIQSKSGFVNTKMPAFNATAEFEDVAVLFFDADKDGDLDLFVGSGGNNRLFPRIGQNRLYKNDGGNFIIDPTSFPANEMNMSVAAANDFDKDGDLDLFVGSRSVPQKYGMMPESQLYINNGSGKFTEVAKSKYPAIARAGMVTDAAWVDISGDKEKELVIIGEWMAPKIFSFSGGSVKELTNDLTALSGWWQDIAVADLDGDGDEDFVLGNIGENFYLRPNGDEPVKMWVNDFDKNGVTDAIMTRTVNKKDVPAFLKRDLTDQIPSLKKQNLKHVDYASKSIQELFPSELISSAEIRQFNYSSSCIAYNDGNGKFTIQRLPAEIQFSSVNAILCTDIDNDGKKDLIIGGNKFGFQPQFSRLDGSTGNILMNRGGRKFEVQSTLNVDGEVRDIQEIRNGTTKFILFLRNNEAPLLYKISSPGKKETR